MTNLFKNARNAVMMAIDQAAEDVDTMPEEGSEDAPPDKRALLKERIEKIKEAGEAAKEAAQAEANRLASLNAQFESVTLAAYRSRQRFKGIQEMVTSADGFIDNACQELAGRFDETVGLHPKFRTWLAEFDAVKRHQEKILAYAKAELDANEKTLADFLKKNRDDLKTIGIENPS